MENKELNTKIGKMLYSLSNEDRATAHGHLKQILKDKVDTRFNEECNRIKKALSEKNN